MTKPDSKNPIDDLIKELDKLEEQKIKIGNITFMINKLSVRPAWHLFDEIREGMLNKEIANPLNNPAFDTFKALLSLPTSFVEHVQNVLFEPVKAYRDEDKNAPISLNTKDGIDSAFEKLEPIHLYELMLRAFIVNFRKSFDIVAKLKNLFESITELV